MANKRVIQTRGAPQAMGSCAQAIVHKSLVFGLGQLPLNPETGQVVTANPTEQVRRMTVNVCTVLETGGSSLEDVLKAHIYVKDLGQLEEINEAYGSYFQDLPLHKSIEVSRVPRAANNEIEVVSALREPGGRS
jgi:2-iminobutanoate/2-iminopropanoate deaminase